MHAKRLLISCSCVPYSSEVYTLVAELIGSGRRAMDGFDSGVVEGRGEDEKM